MRDVLPAIAGSDHVLRWYLALSVERQIAGAGSDEELRRADITQPMLSALTRVLRDNGATPTGFVGDRIGKIAAALAAGALLLNDAALIVSIRSWHQERTCRADEWPHWPSVPTPRQRCFKNPTMRLRSQPSTAFAP